MDILTINDTPGEYPPSWYAATATPPGPYPRARGDLRADVCVVGGGFTGLSAALHLARRGYDVALVEAQRVGFGASGRNGGQVGTGQRVEQPELEKMVGRADAHKLWDIGLDSVALVRDLIAEGQIDCGFVPGVIHADHRARFVPQSRAHVDHMKAEYGYDLIRFLDRDAMRAQVGSPAYHGGTLDMGGGHLHPLRFAFGLARMAQAAGVRIYEQSRMIAVEGGSPAVVRLAEATIRADHVVMAMNGYLGDAEPRVATRVMPINNFIAVTEPLGAERARGLIRDNHAVADSKFVINYFRLSDDHRMIFGGGESYGYRFPADIKAKVRKPMLQIFPQLADARLEYAWGGTLGITMSRLPHFARLGGNVMSTSGFSGHGVAMGTLAGKMAAEAIAGQAEQFDLMANLPGARFPGGPALRAPLLAAAMIWYSLRDRL
ncbi:NAD(P)/FAD-dependent oxidoreductase [Actibacterium sp. D379-3]